jgi:hypothetical protein
MPEDAAVVLDVLDVDDVAAGVGLEARLFTCMFFPPVRNFMRER